MTLEEWVRADDATTWAALAALTPRRQRLLASAICRLLGRLAAHPSVAVALDANERFADTGKTKVGLKRAREALRNARVELGDPTPDPVAWAPNAGTFLALLAVEIACTEQATIGAIREASRALREGPGLSKEESLRALYPAYSEVAGPTPPVAFSPEWRTTTAVQLARGIYESRDFSAMPILADALQDAGCENAEVLNHCRDPQQVHVRGCWVVDLVLDK